MPGMAGGATCGGVTDQVLRRLGEADGGHAPQRGRSWSAPPGGASVVVDGARKFSGAKSLHYKTSGGGRVMLKFTAAVPHRQPARPADAVRAQQDRQQQPLGHDPEPQQRPQPLGAGRACTATSSWSSIRRTTASTRKTPFPVRRQVALHPVELQAPGRAVLAKLDGAAGQARARSWAAGSRAAGQDLTVGWEIFGSYATEFWIDDLAFGEQEIPCPAAP